MIGAMLRPPEEFRDVRVFTAPCFPDERGFLLQSYVASTLASMGIEARFRQAIQSSSRRGVVRGLHFQWDPAQAKLIRCVSGSVFDVLVDVRLGSPTFGDHLVVELTGENRKVLWAPEGFAHGFMALQEDSIVLYECTAEYNASGEGGILWNDPRLGISWPPIPPIVSAKDRRLPDLDTWVKNPLSERFRFAR
jgi:dTDP-4-dehydrorhamnose 3,5-epimerase